MQETVTAAEIARLAGVGRAAVSNWRKRHADFPAPIEGTNEFDLREAQEWLRRQGKLAERSSEERAWSQIVVSGNDVVDVLASVASALTAGDAPALTAVADLTTELGPTDAFDRLLYQFVSAKGWRFGVTPDPLAELMVGLAGVAGGTLLDPACGTGGLLRASIGAACTGAFGQEVDERMAELATAWLTLHGASGRVAVGDSLRADAYSGLLVDAVVSNLPVGDSNWGHEDLGYDPRWEYGTPPRTEPELAWVQHALAHLKPGGTAVLLLPPSVASRRAGRRIRSELVRRGALRAVVALPPKAAAPHGVPMHLWVLRRPEPSAEPPTHVLLADAIHLDAILPAYEAFVRDDEPDVGRAVPSIELLDEDVDLTPSRRQPTTSTVDATDVALIRRRLVEVLGELPGLVPALTSDAERAVPEVSIAELAKTGALSIVGPLRPGADEVAQVDDVLVPMGSRRLAATVVEQADTPIDTMAFLLRPNPAALDPWFLAGQLRTSTNERRAASASGAHRMDVRRVRIPRLPIEQQRHIGVAFRRLHVFDEALRQAADLGTDLLRVAIEGLAHGALRLEGETGQPGESRT